MYIYIDCQIQLMFVIYLHTYICNSPVAVKSITSTCTKIQYGDGLLRTSTGCTVPLCSRILYVD